MFKKSILLIFALTLIYCEDNVRTNICFQNILPPISLDLNNPQLNRLLTPTGFVEVNGGLQGIILYNGATLGYKAFDRKCPKFDCNTPMSFDGLKLKCSCDNREFSILTGEPLNQEADACFAREYNVIQNRSSLTISD